jgi:hypothetical protein
VVNKILGYFDLNKRISSNSRKSPANLELASIPDDIVHVLEPLSQVAVWKQIVLYIGTVVGVLFSTAIIQYKTGQVEALHISITSILLSLTIALILMPNIYEKALKPDTPFIVELGIFVQQGVFWSIVLTAIGQTFH